MYFPKTQASESSTESNHDQILSGTILQEEWQWGYQERHLLLYQFPWSHWTRTWSWFYACCNHSYCCIWDEGIGMHWCNCSQCPSIHACMCQKQSTRHVPLHADQLFWKAEHCNKINLYFACMHLSLPLHAVKNCINYVLIFTDMLRYWDGCSPAEEDLLRKYALKFPWSGLLW